MKNKPDSHIIPAMKNELEAHNLSEIKPYRDTIFPKDSVGSIMDPHYLSFREKSTVKEAIEMIRFLSNNNVPLLYAYVVDDHYHLVGVIVMRDLLVSPDSSTIKDIMRKNVYSINVYRNKDEVAQEAIDKKYLAVPIVDNDNHLLGALKFGDILDYSQEESTKDVQKMFGAGAEETASSSIWFKIKKRLPWLKVNLLTAFLAAAVIGCFEGIIAKVTALAIFLPVIAGQGGNTGAQSLAVIIRALALDQIPHGSAKKIIFREVVAGTLNGILLGVITALIAWLWVGNPYFGFIVGLAMVLNMVVAVIFGALIPLIMRKMSLDPAQCSNIVLTTFTDVFGFLILLVLALYFQNYLV